MKKMNGFTLIELLAVIVILAIIAVIATPLTINVINSSKEKSFINSVYGLIDGARLLSAEQLFDDGSNEVVVNFTDGTADNTEFKVSGDMPNSGTLHLNSDVKVELKVWSEELGMCAEKSVNEAEVKLTETTKENCKLEVKEDTSTGQTVKEVMESATGETAYDGTIDNNLRYVGKTPNNYVKFNGDELWRIIGVFNGQAKIIRNDYYSTEIAWDEDDGSYSNNWATASLNLLWNDEENENSYINTIEKNDPTSYGYIDLEHVWNIGGTPNYNSSTRSDFYTAERSGTPAGATGSEATWTGAIGLMYPSDYGYASSGLSETCNNTVMYKWRTSKDETAYTECAQKSWLYDSSKNQWTLTPRSDGSNYAFFVYDAGHVYSIYVYYSFAARPVLYLKSDTKIVGGLGTSDQPYELGV